MTYLDPYTPWIMRWFQQYLILPTIIYFAIALSLFVIGLGVYLTSTDFSLDDVLSLLPTTVISVRKSINRRRVSAVFFVLLGLAGLFTFADQLQVEGSQPGGGGPSVYPCRDLPILCPRGSQSSGAVSSTNSTLCTSTHLPNCGYVLKTNSTLCTSNNGLCLTSDSDQTVWRTNAAVLVIPTWVTDPFTTTSTTPVALTGLTATIRQFNAANGVNLLFTFSVTVKVSAGSGELQFTCDGVTCGSGAVFTNTNFMTIAGTLAQNNTFTDNLSHTFALYVASDNVAHTVSVCATDSNCAGLPTLGNVVSLMSVYDLTIVA